MKHVGDITKLNGAELPVVDILTGGSPCQDLSLAGKRAGLAGERSGLFMEQIRLIKEMRENDKRTNGRTDATARPRFMVWENVPGAFSSNGGEDFRAVLEETARVVDENADVPRPADGWESAGAILGDGWSIAWRVHDAQFWGRTIRDLDTGNVLKLGTPQRRRRIALVADFNGGSATEILFEPYSLSGDFEQGQESWEGTSEGIGGCTDPSGTIGAILFQERAGCAGRGKGILIQNERKATLRAQAGGHNPIVFGISSYDSNAMKSDNPKSGIYIAETARTLDLNGGNPSCNQGGMAIIQGVDVYNGSFSGDVAATLTEACGGTNTSGAKVLCVDQGGGKSSCNVSDDCSPTLTTTHGGEPVVSYGLDAYNQTIDKEIAQSLRAADGGDTTPKVICIEGNGSRPSHKGDGYSEIDVMYTLNATEQHVVAYRKTAHAKSPEDGQGEEEKIGCQTAMGPGAVAVDCRNGVESEINASLQASADHNNNSNNVCRSGCVVRRLTPLECTRLQGFPDGWVDIGEWTDSKGKKHKDSDAPKYKALGNSIALPFWAWMAKRMRKQFTEENVTMASLFDGIGGFPLVYSWAGVKPVWCSEIEEFCIALTKLRFPEEQK